MNGRRQRLHTGAFLLLGVLLSQSISAADYKECSLEVGTFDEDNLKLKLTCMEGGESKELHDPTVPIPINTQKEFDGTPITLFGTTGAVVEIADTADTFTLTKSTFNVLPNKLESATAPLTLRDARVTLIECVFKENTHATSGGIHLVGTGETIEDAGLTKPSTGPYVEISKTTFEGGNGKAGGLFIDSFPFVVVKETSFLPNKQALDSSFVEHKGFGSAIFTDCEFTGPESVQSVDKATALYGSGSGTVKMEGCTFKRMVGSAIDWESTRNDKAKLVFMDCTFSDCYSQTDGGVFLVKSPLMLAVHKSTFTNNDAGNQGGVFHVGVNDPADRLQLDIHASEFTANRADKGGSVIYLDTTGQDADGYTAEISLHDCKIHDNLLTTPIHMKGGGFVNLTIAGGTFENNEDRFLGGALGLEQMAKVEISGALFKENRVIGTTERSKIPSGGAINCKEIEELSIVDSRFEGNELVTTEAGTGGGAIFLSNDEAPLRVVEARVLKIEGTHFVNNAAGSSGGSLYVTKVDHVNLIGATFNQDDGVQGSGGIVYATHAKIFNIKDSTFKNGKSGVNGGGLWLNECKEVSVVGSTIEGNSVEASSEREEANFLAETNADSHTGSGGGLLMLCDSATECSLDIQDSEFSGNKAISEGGALLVSSVVGCNFTNTDFVQKDKVSGNGGAVKIDAKELKVVGGSFSGGQSDMGGGVYLESAQSIDISGTKFSSNVAEQSGSALYFVAPPDAKDEVDVKIADATFTRNKADMNDGGSLFLKDLGAFSMKGSEFSGNYGGGVVLNSVTAEVAIVSTEFTEGKSDGSGAAVNVDTTPKVTIDGSTFHANSAFDGGALQLANVTDLTMTDSTFSKNKAKRYGGGAHLLNIESAAISDVTFSDNRLDGKEKILAGCGLAMKAVENINLTKITATGNKNEEAFGGGVSAYEGLAISVEKCTFEGNAAGAAGALSVQEFSDSAAISDSTFKGNEAGNGGAVFVANTPSVEANVCMFSGNKADQDGGAIRMNNGTATLTVTASHFNRNTARLGSGGGISAGLNPKGIETLSSVDKLSCENSTFLENHAKNGGAINVVGATEVEIASTQFEGCYAEENGGSVNFFAFGLPAVINAEGNSEGKPVTITGSDFMGSSTKNGNGGSLAVAGAGDAVLSSANISDSKGKNGGAVFFHLSNDVQITDVEISNSEATDGGAILVSKSNSLDITNGDFKQNYASEDGGTLVVEDTKTTIASTVISNSEAGGKGGGVYLADSEFSISDSTVGQSEAKYGGALAVSGESTVTLQSVNFTDNTATSWQGSVVFADSCNSKVSAEGICSVEIPFKKGFGGMSTEEDALALALDVEGECSNTEGSLNMSACEYEYNVISGVGAFMILAYVLLGLGVLGLLVMFGLVAVMKTSLTPAKAPQPTLEPLMDEEASLA